MYVHGTSFVARHKRTLLVLLFLFLYSVSISYAVPPTSSYQPGETLDPSCAPGETNCTVTLFPEQSGNAGKLLTTNGTTTLWTNTVSDLTFSNAPRFASLSANAIPFISSGGGVLTESPELTFSPSTNTLHVSNLTVPGTVIFSGSLASSITPSSNLTYDIGSPAYMLRNIYVDTITANSISAGNSAISGSTAQDFTFNSDNTSADTEDITLIFDRGTEPNALLSWNSTDDRFEFDQNVAITTLGAGVLRSSATGLLSSDATTSDLTEGTNLYYTDERFNTAFAAKSTDDLSEGSTNLYYTNTRSRAALSSTATGLTYNNTSGVLSLTSGYTIPTTTESSNWTAAYNSKITYLDFDSGTGGLTLHEQDGGTTGFLLYPSLDTRYQTRANLSSDLTSSTTKYPSVNAVNTGLATKANTNGSNATGTWPISIAGSAPTLTTARTLWGQSFDGSADVSGALTDVTGITTSGGYTQSGTSSNTFTGASSITTNSFGAALSVTRNANGADPVVKISTSGNGQSAVLYLESGGSDGSKVLNVSNAFFVNKGGTATAPTFAASTSITNSGSYTQSGTNANIFTGTSTFSNATYSALFTGGSVGIGTTTPSAALHILKTTEQLRLGYNATSYAAFTVDASSNVAIVPGTSTTASFSFGYLAGKANNSNFLGNKAGNGTGSASESNFFGNSAGQSANNASKSNFFGSNAGYQATNANFSNFIGASAGYTATSATYSNFFGINAGASATNASFSNFFGYQAGNGATSATGSNFFGTSAGYLATSATYSNFFGSNAGSSAINASNSNFIGRDAGNGATNAKNSIFIGTSAGANDTVNNTTSADDFSILIGKSTSTGGFSNSIALGGSAINTASNQFMLGSATRPINDMRIIGDASSMISFVSNTSSTAVNASIGQLAAGGLSFSGSGTLTADTHMVIAADGNVGIGTTTPGEKLSVYDNANTYKISLNSSTDTFALGISGSNDALFYNNGAEQMRIAADGNVGIGTTNPNYKLSLGSTGDAIGYYGDATHYASILPFQSTDGAFIFNHQSGGLGGYDFRYGGGSQMYISVNGNVGIGTTAPVGKLGIGDQEDIVETSGITLGRAESSVEFVGANYQNGYGFKLFTPDDGSGGNFVIAGRANTTAWTNMFSITNTGNVGIGTTSQSNNAKLEIVQSGASSIAARLINVDGGTMLQLSDNADFVSYLGLDAANNRMWLGPSYGTGIAIADNGKVGIGTTNPVNKLDIQDSGSANIHIIGNTDSSGYGESGILFGVNGTDYWQNFIYASNTTAYDSLRWYSTVSGTSPMVLTPTGNLTISGTLSQSSDYRLKDNITLLDGQSWTLQENLTTYDDTILDRIMALRPVTYTMKSDSTGHLQSGFIAQEVQDIFPELVTLQEQVKGEGQSMYALNYVGLLPYTIKAIQEMNMTMQALPTFADQSLAQKVADFLRGIAERGEAVVNLVRSKKVQTQELCVGTEGNEVCITKDQLQQMLNTNGSMPSYSGGGGTGTNTTTDGQTPGETDQGSDGSTTTTPATIPPDTTQGETALPPATTPPTVVVPPAATDPASSTATIPESPQ